MSQEPQRFGKYQIIERIAAGGMAEVFKARLEGIGGFHRTYAIKRILPHLTSNADFVDMLVDEAKVAGLLSHANIVQILDLGAVDDQYFIAMEYVNGKDLGQILERCNKKGITLPFPHAVYVLIEMLKGLEYAHNRHVVRDGVQVPLNIIHRDISPANVLVSIQGEVKLTDFGIAKAAVKAAETQAGVIKGRFDYMAPEQAAGRDLDQRADLFAAGVVFYELLTGRHPFREAADLKTLEAVRRGHVVPPSQINPDVPVELDAVIADALRLDPKDRFASATAFKDALNTFFHNSGFIFSAATLATFVRGLLQEGERPPPKPSEVDTGPIARRAAAERGAAALPAPAVQPEVAPAPGPTPVGVAPTLSRQMPAPSRIPVDSRPPGATRPPAQPQASRVPAPPQASRVPAQAARAAATVVSPGAPATVVSPGAPRASQAPPVRAPEPPRPSLPPPKAPSPIQPLTLPQVGLGEESTLIRNPTLDANSHPLAAGPGLPSQWSDAATMIRPDPFAPSAPDRSRHEARQIDIPSDRGQVMRRPALDGPKWSRPPGNAEGGRSDEPRSRVVYRTPNGVHLGYVTLCFVALVLGLGFGILLGRTAPVRSEPGLLQAPPAIEVRAPAGFTATVDGKPLAGNPPWTTSLVANTPAVVSVQGPGYGPVEARLQLQPNQMRILDFTPAATGASAGTTGATVPSASPQGP